MIYLFNEPSQKRGVNQKVRESKIKSYVNNEAYIYLLRHNNYYYSTGRLELFFNLEVLLSSNEERTYKIIYILNCISHLQTHL